HRQSRTRLTESAAATGPLPALRTSGQRPRGSHERKGETTMDVLARDWMTDAEALAWTVERDRLLRATHAALWLLDRAPDRGRFEWKVERGARQLLPVLKRVDAH